MVIYVLLFRLHEHGYFYLKFVHTVATAHIVFGLIDCLIDCNDIYTPYTYVYTYHKHRCTQIWVYGYVYIYVCTCDVICILNTYIRHARGHALHYAFIYVAIKRNDTF